MIFIASLDQGTTSTRFMIFNTDAVVATGGSHVHGDPNCQASPSVL